jgi:hypothetical protein
MLFIIIYPPSQVRARSLGISVICVVVIVLAVVFLVFLFFLVELFSKEEIGGPGALIEIWVEQFRAYSAHA